MPKNVTAGTDGQFTRDGRLAWRAQHSWVRPARPPHFTLYGMSATEAPPIPRASWGAVGVTDNGISRLPAAVYVACIKRSLKSRSLRPCPRRSPRSPRLGIGWRLGLGLAAVTAVLLLGESLATRTARQALEAVRSMQTEDEPLANRANAVLEKLIAYDRAVGEYVRPHSADDKLSTITLAGDALEAAVAEYFSSAPPRAVTAAATGLRQQLTRHIANARQLATRASQRLQWDALRQAALDDVYRRIVSAGGSGLAINGTQVVAERSLAELHTAINEIGRAS